MADQKISELTNITGANLADADEFVVVDTSADKTKAVTRVQFFKNTPPIDVNGTVTAGDIEVSGGVVFGATGGSVTSKTLDDYEEGTWTPVISDGTNNATSNIAVGSYTKTGNHVHVQGRVRLSSLGSATGALEMTGLPFTSQSLTNNFCAMTIGRAIGLNLVAGTTMVGDLRSAVTTVKLLVFDASLGNTAIQDTEFTDAGDISFSMDYLSN